MRIDRIETLHCRAGDRVWSFLKVSTDEGLSGWAEFTEHVGSQNLAGVIEKLGEYIVGSDPREYERVRAVLFSKVRQASGGLAHRALGAIENALLDVTARSLGVPVWALFGGPIRERVPVYWSHCGLLRVRGNDPSGLTVRSLQDLEELGAEAAARGFRALKANIYLFRNGAGVVHLPAWGAEGFPALNVTPPLIRAMVDEVTALQRGAGPDVEINIDVNCHFKPEGYVRLGRAFESLSLGWMELDVADAQALSSIRQACRVPIASGETLHGRQQYKRFFELSAFDVVIVDVAWNGLFESLKIAALADMYEVNVAPHNYAGPLMTAMSANLATVIPNLRMMEVDVDGVPWRDELLSPGLVVKDGELQLPSGPGWGSDVREEVIRAHAID